MAAMLFVAYNETRFFGDDQDVTIGASAQVPKDGDPAVALRDLQQWVRARIDERVAEHERREAEARAVGEKSRELAVLEDRIARAKLKWDRIIAFFQKHDIPWPDSFREQHDDLPF